MKSVLNMVTASLHFTPKTAPGTRPPRESGRPVWNWSIDSSSGITNSVNPDLAAQANDADFAVRIMEIEAKASSAIILLLLKWLKISRKYYQTAVGIVNV
jgi:hypothetical protein